MRKISILVKELILGILLFGVVVQAAGVWFAVDKLRYSTGLWIGIALAVFMAIHMNATIERALDGGEKYAVSAVRKGYAFRIMVFFISFIVVYYLNIGSVLTMFLGVMGLKAAAYMQPLLHKKVREKLKRKGKGR